MVDRGRWIQDALCMIPEDLFCDRRQEIERILEGVLRLPRRPGESCALVGPRLAGGSEVAKRVYRDLFLNQREIVPFYYRFERAFHDPATFARDYLTILVRQYLAFAEENPRALLPPVVSFRTVERAAREQGIPALDRIFSDYKEGLEDPDRERLLRLVLQTPETLAGAGEGRAAVVLDHLHQLAAMAWPGCASLAALYAENAAAGRTTYLFTGSEHYLRREFLSQETAARRIRTLPLAPFSRESSVELLRRLCEAEEVPCDGRVLEEAWERFHGIPFYMHCVIRRAREKKVPLTAARVLQDLLSEEVAVGEIALYYDSLLNRSFPDPFAKRDALRLLTLEPLVAGRTLHLEEAARRLSLDRSRVGEIARVLLRAGLLRGDYAMVAAVGDPVLGAFLTAARRFWRGGTDTATGFETSGLPEMSVLKELRSRPDRGKGGAEAEEGRISFGLVLPMVSETELVAARALEQVAERVEFPEEEIGKIRMALIEACINAFEHSGSRDGKIYITFILDQEKLTILVEDKGVSFDPRRVPAPERSRPPEAGRRGWGIELIRNFMDQVAFEEVPVGTRLRMVKYYPRAAGREVRAG